MDASSIQKLPKLIKRSKLAFFLCAVFVLSAIRSIYCYIHRKYNKYPPGPIGLPFFGSLFSCIDIPKYALHLASKYGVITMIYVGSQPFIFLNTIKYINEINKNENALDRDWDKSLIYRDFKSYEINTVGVAQKYWPRKRKMLQHVMMSRLNSNFINNVHNKSFEYVFESIDKLIQQNKLWFPFQHMSYLQFHFIWNAVFGTNISFHSQHKQNIMNFIRVCLKEASGDVILRYLGVVKYLPSKWTESIFPTYKKYQNYLEKVLYEQLNYDKNVFDMNDNTWSQHFKDIQNNEDSCAASQLIASHRSNPGIDSVRNSIMSELMVFFVAGVDTTLNTAEYGVVLLAKYPQIQDKIYNEVFSIFNNDWKMENVIFTKQVIKLHYLRAFIHEVLRISSVVPIGVAHYNSKCDIWSENKKYCIPQNSVIISNISNANRNDKYWENKTNGNSKNLCIDLWLDENNHFKYNLNKDKMVGFGAGRRDCAGQAIAKRSLYLLFIKLILNYQFNLAPKDQNKEIKQTFEFVFVIEPKIGIHVTKRNMQK
eukprot:490283_1